MVDADTKRKAIRVLSANGRAPNCAESMSDEELTVLASLLGDDGLLIDGAPGLFRELLVEHHERLKASDAELDEPAADFENVIESPEETQPEKKSAKK